MSVQGVGTEEFIDEVKKHPCIWNHQCEDYRRTSLKNKAWEQVTRAFIENYDELGDFDRINLSKKFQSKWRNLRDSYVRAQKKKPAEGSKDYLFARNLSFLEIAYGDKLRVRVSSDSDDSSDGVGTRVKRIKKERDCSWNKKGESTSADFSLEYVGTSCEVEPLVHPVQRTMTGPEEFDDDRLFFESLLPATRQFDLDQKLQFRSEVLSLISKIRQNGRANPLDHKF